MGANVLAFPKPSIASALHKRSSLLGAARLAGTQIASDCEAVADRSDGVGYQALEFRRLFEELRDAVAVLYDTAHKHGRADRSLIDDLSDAAKAGLGDWAQTLFNLAPHLSTTTWHEGVNGPLRHSVEVTDYDGVTTLGRFDRIEDAERASDEAARALRHEVAS